MPKPCLVQRTWGVRSTQDHSLTYDRAAGTGVEWSQSAASASSRKERNGIASLATKYIPLCAVSGQFR